jgi:hypothetical protein
VAGFLYPAIGLLINHKSMASPQVICSNCGYIGSAEKKKKGHIAIEIILYLFYIIPGIIYSIWRRTGRSNVCPTCKQMTLVPIESPVGQRLMKENYKQP